jgi:exonuclease III
MLESMNADVATLQETRMKEPEAVDIGRYTLLLGAADNRLVGGVGFAVSKDTVGSVLEFEFISYRLAYMKFDIRGRNRWVISAYAPTNEASEDDKDEFWDAFLQLVRRIPATHDVIIGMDANAVFSATERHDCLGQWHIDAKETTDNGRRLLELCDAAELSIASTFKRTRRSRMFTWTGNSRLSKEEQQRRGTRHLRAQLDYVLLRTSQIGRMRKSHAVPHTHFDSDHKPTLAVVSGEIARRKYQRPPERLDSTALKDCDVRVKFQGAVLDKMIHGAMQKNITAESWTRSIAEAAKSTLPTNNVRRSARTFSEQAMKIYEKMCDTRHAGDLAGCRRLRRAVRRQLQRDREQVWEQRVEELQAAWNAKNPRKVYTLLRAYSGRITAPTKTLKTAHGIVTGEHTLPVWKEYFETLLNRPPPTLPELAHQFRAPYSVSLRRPEEQEVLGAIRKMTNNKAPGDDDITPEMLKALPRCAITALTNIIGDIWETQRIPDDWRNAVVIPLHKKGPKQDPANFRGISLLRSSYKILERIIVDRIIKARETTARDEQAGFRPGRSTVDQIFCLRQIMEVRRNHRKELHIAFLDFAAAFDCPDRERLFKALKADGVPPKIVELLADMNDHSTATVRTAAGLSERFQVRTGVRQGSVAGPLLFNYAVDDVMRRTAELHPSAIRLHPTSRTVMDLEYADDIAVLAESPEELQRIVTTISQLAASYGLRLRPEKCKQLWTNIKPDTGVSVDGEKIELVPEFCYLGSVISGNGDLTRDVTQRCRKAESAFGTLWKCLWSQPISNEMKLRVYLTAIRPIFLYSSETWAMTTSLVSKVDALERRFLRRILGYFYPDRKHNYELYEDVNKIMRRLSNGRVNRLNRPSEEIATRRLRWLGHILRRPHDRIVHLSLRLNPPQEWKRAPGRKRVTWNEAVKKSIDDAMRLHIKRDELQRQLWNSSEWMELLYPIAQDRDAWNEFCAKLVVRS